MEIASKKTPTILHRRQHQKDATKAVYRALLSE